MPNVPSITGLHMRYRLWIAEMNYYINILRILEDYLLELAPKNGATEIQDGINRFKEEFVTCGGIKLSEIDANTMQSKIVPHLFFAGEIMNIDGITGGFNFQNAWTSGWIAAQHIAAIKKENTVE